jgi:hypothetical protein
MHSVPIESYRPRVWREADNHTDLFNDPVESKPHDPVPVQRRLAFIQLGGVAHFGQVNLIFRIVAPPKIRSPRSAPLLDGHHQKQSGPGFLRGPTYTARGVHPTALPSLLIMPPQSPLSNCRCRRIGSAWPRGGVGALVEHAAQERFHSLKASQK